MTFLSFAMELQMNNARLVDPSLSELYLSDLSNEQMRALIQSRNNPVEFFITAMINIVRQRSTLPSK